MAVSVTLTPRAIPGVQTAFIWECTTDSDANGNISTVDISWTDMRDAPTRWNGFFAVVYGVNTSSPENHGGTFTIVPDYTNRRFRVTGRGFPASTTNIRFLFIAF